MILVIDNSLLRFKKPAAYLPTAGNYTNMKGIVNVILVFWECKFF